MKKKLLQMIIGAAVVAGCYTSVMASEMGTINQTTNVYILPEYQSQSLYWVYEGENFEVSNEEVGGGFCELLVDNQKVYVQRDAISLESDKQVEAAEEMIEQMGNASKGEEVVAFAKQFIGTSYVSGGNSLTSGVDCSGFVQQVYNNFNIHLQRSSRDQYACNGYEVSRSELQPGDLVFYGYGSVCHVSMYIGNDQVIHAPVPGKSVCIVPIYQRGDAPIIGYKRVL